jgi:hypothetical protein
MHCPGEKPPPSPSSRQSRERSGGMMEREGVGEGEVPYFTFQSFQVSQYCHMAFGW